MKPKKCPECATEILRYWPNPIRKDHYVGRCPTCRKMVNLGNVEATPKDDKGGKPAQTPKEQQPAQQPAGKAPARAHRKRGSGKRARRPDGSHQHSQQPAEQPKRAGFGGFIREFFDL